MNHSRRVILTLVLGACAATNATADAIRFRGSTFALEGCRIRSIRGGELVFSGPGGRRMQRHLEDVQSLSFEGVEELDRGEEAMLESEYDRAAKWFVLALSKGDGDLQRQWIHTRLSAAHAHQGQYVQAAGHAAAVFALEDNPAWKRLEPMCDPDRPAYAAAKEAYDQLQAARRSVRSAQLVRVLDTMTPIVKAARDEAARGYQGPRLRRGDTISGYTIAEFEHLRETLRAPNTAGAAIAAVPEDEAPIEAPEPEPTPAGDEMNDPATAAPRPAPAARDDIQSLLERGEFRQARIVCESRLAGATRAEAVRLHYLNGAALDGLGRRRDAAVQYMRSYLLQPDSVEAATCLLETAEVYRDEFAHPARAAALLRRAVECADARGQDKIAARARQMLGKLESLSNR